MKNKQAIVASVGVLLLLLSTSLAPGIGLRTVQADGHFGRDLVGWWQFDEGGGTLAADSSGLGNDGTLGGAVAFTADAVVGSALDFTADSGRVDVAHSPSLEPATGTIQAWIKIAVPHAADIVKKTTNLFVRSGVTGGFSVYGLRITPDGRAYGFVANDDPSAPGPWTFAFSPPGLVTPGEWHHLAVRWDGSTVAIFVDGTLRAASSYDPVPGTGLSYSGVSPFGMGVRTEGGGEFIGQLDDVRFYGRARPDIEIFTDFVTGGHKPAEPIGQ